MDIRQIAVFLISRLHGAEFPFHKITVQKQRAVLSVIVIILWIGDSPGKSDPRVPSSVHRMGGATVDHRLQPHLTELKDGRPHHPLKSQVIPDIHRLFL